MLSRSKLWVLIIAIVLLVTTIDVSETCAYWKDTWDLKLEDPFKTESVVGKPVEDGYEFMLLKRYYSFFYYFNISQDVGLGSKVFVETHVSEAQNTAVGVGLGNDRQGYVLEIFPSGKVELNYWERFPSKQMDYWKVWEGKIKPPTFPLKLRCEYEGIPAQIKGFINGEMFVTLDLEKNPVGSNPRTINRCGVKVASMNESQPYKAVFLNLTVEGDY